MAGLGTGGTLMGVGRRLREELGDAVKIVAAEPMQGEPVQGLRSLDDGFIPPIIDLSLLDRKIFVTNRDAIVWTKKLLDEEGIFAGVSTGAIASIAVRIANELDEGNVVFIVCDDGWKYLSSGLYTTPVDELENLDYDGLVVDSSRAARRRRGDPARRVRAAGGDRGRSPPRCSRSSCGPRRPCSRPTSRVGDDDLSIPDNGARDAAEGTRARIVSSGALRPRAPSGPPRRSTRLPTPGPRGRCSRPSGARCASTSRRSASCAIPSGASCSAS